MQVNDKTYWELCIKINPLIADVLCDIIQSEFECEGIVTEEETYKNLELVKTTRDTLKAYIIADSLDFNEIKRFFKEKRKELTDAKIFDFDLGSWDVEIKKQEIVDWSKKWKENWKPTKISDKIVICPSWEHYKKSANEIIVNIDPGNAFGTGTHATTQLCIKACEKYMQKGSLTADIGTGSGILAICAMKLGAKNIDAVDNDPTVIETAKNNALINKENTINFKLGTSDILPSSKYDFVFANILHNVLAQIMPDLKRIMKKGAKIVLSGIIEGKEPTVKEAIEKNGMKIIEEMRQQEWIAFVVEKEI